MQQHHMELYIATQHVGNIMQQHIGKVRKSNARHLAHVFMQSCETLGKDKREVLMPGRVPCINQNVTIYNSAAQGARQILAQLEQDCQTFESLLFAHLDTERRAIFETVCKHMATGLQGEFKHIFQEACQDKVQQFYLTCAKDEAIEDSCFIAPLYLPVAQRENCMGAIFKILAANTAIVNFLYKKAQQALSQHEIDMLPQHQCFLGMLQKIAPHGQGIVAKLAAQMSHELQGRFQEVFSRADFSDLISFMEQHTLDAAFCSMYEEGEEAKLLLGNMLTAQPQSVPPKKEGVYEKVVGKIHKITSIFSSILQTMKY